MSWIADWVEQTLTDVEPTDDPVRQDLEARVEAVAAEREAQQLFSTSDDAGIYADVAADLLRELEWYLRTLDDSSDVVSRTPRGAGNDSSSHVVPFDEMTRAVREVLKAIGKTTTMSTQFNSDTQAPFEKTRTGSGTFDKWWIGEVLPALHDEFVRNANRRLQEFCHTLPYRMTLAEVSSGSAGKTGQGKDITMADIWIELHVWFPDLTEPVSIKMPVNLKCIENGEKPCNTGGAKMLIWAMLAAEQECQKVIWTRAEISKALDDVSTGDDGQLELDLTTGLSDTDYYFLVFEKNAEVEGQPCRPLGDVWVSSILTIDPDTGLYNNPAQSWPFIQARYRPASQTLVIPRSWDEARERLWDWQLANERKIGLEILCHAGPGRVARGVQLTGKPEVIKQMTQGFTFDPDDIARNGL